MTRINKIRVGCGSVAFVFLLVLLVFLFQARQYLLGPEGAYFTSDGVRLHYTDEGEGTPVILVHGFGNHAHLQWRRTGMTALLSPHYRVITLDARGHGRSDKSHDPDRYGVPMAEDLVRLMDHLKIEKAHVVGYSMGGFITLKLVALHPDRLLSAAVCGAGWWRPIPETRSFAEKISEAVRRADTGPLEERLAIPPAPHPWLNALFLHLSNLLYNDLEALALVALGSRELTVTQEELQRNQVPVLTLIGDQDGLLPEARLLEETMANHEQVIIEGENHLTADTSDAFRQELLRFLKRHSPTDAVFERL